MPIYVYRCPECFAEEEIIMSIGNDCSRGHCNSIMQRMITLPQPAIIKQTGNDMALNSLNSKDTRHMRTQQKAIAAKGLECPPKVFF